jgi:single-strand DNA-binding protein
MKNLAILTGKVKSEIEVTEVKEGVKKAVFSLVTWKTWKDENNEKQAKTQLHRIVCWRGLAEIVEKYVKKDSLLQIDGEIEYSEYTKDEIKRYSTEIKADNIIILPTANKEESNS